MDLYSAFIVVPHTQGALCLVAIVAITNDCSNRSTGSYWKQYILCSSSNSFVVDCI